MVDETWTYIDAPARERERHEGRDRLDELDEMIDALTGSLALLLEEPQRTLSQLQTLAQIRRGDSDERVDPLTRQRAIFRHELDVHQRAEDFHQRAADLHANGGRGDLASAESAMATTHRAHYTRLRAKHPDWAPHNP